MKRYLGFLSLLLTSLLVASSAFAAEGGGIGTAGDGGLVGLGSGIAIGIAILGATLGQAKAIATALESIGRNPSAAGKIFTPMIIGLVFIEALGIFAFVIAFSLAGKI